MADISDRNAAVDALVRATINGSEEDIVEALFHLNQSAEPERKTGRWQITDAYPHNVYCSECHAKFAQTHWAVWEDGSLPRNFCPNCGAKMEGEEDD